MKAGVVVYRRHGQNLVGEWTHEFINGELALDVMFNVPVGDIEGGWPIKIFRPNSEFCGRDA